MQNLEELKKQVELCEKCELCSNNATKVFGKGNEHAEIMIIGEAPGCEEVKNREPFVGKAGVKLKSYLKEAGFDIEKDIYFCNVLKCRTTDENKNKNKKDRRPQKDEIKNCRTFLEQQIEIIKPKVIILCGVTAMKFFKITELLKIIHGKEITKNGRKIYPVYHPVARVKDEIKINDLKNIKRKIKEQNEQ